MRYKINFSRVVNQLVPYYLGGRKLILLLQAMLYPLQKLNDSFSQWARDRVIEANMTSQIIKLEWYLNYKFSKYFNNPNERISIQNAVYTGVELHSENTSSAIIHKSIRFEGESSAAEDNIVFYHSDEKTESNNKSFYVVSPAIDTTMITVNEYLTMVSYQVDRFKTSGKTYEIRINNE